MSDYFNEKDLKDVKLNIIIQERYYGMKQYIKELKKKKEEEEHFRKYEQFP